MFNKTEHLYGNNIFEKNRKQYGGNKYIDEAILKNKKTVDTIIQSIKKLNTCDKNSEEYIKLVTEVKNFKNGNDNLIKYINILQIITQNDNNPEKQILDEQLKEIESLLEKY